MPQSCGCIGTFGPCVTRLSPLPTIHNFPTLRSQIGAFELKADEIKNVIQDALVASEGGEKASPLGIEADYGGAQDVLLMLGLAFERVSSKLKSGGAKGADGTKYLFMTDAQLQKFDKVKSINPLASTYIHCPHTHACMLTPFLSLLAL